jgi:hypothetical protein
MNKHSEIQALFERYAADKLASDQAESDYWDHKALEPVDPVIKSDLDVFLAQGRLNIWRYRLRVLDDKSSEAASKFSASRAALNHSLFGAVFVVSWKGVDYSIRRGGDWGVKIKRIKGSSG